MFEKKVTINASLEDAFIYFNENFESLPNPVFFSNFEVNETGYISATSILNKDGDNKRRSEFRLKQSDVVSYDSFCSFVEYAELVNSGKIMYEVSVYSSDFEYYTFDSFEEADNKFCEAIFNHCGEVKIVFYAYDENGIITRVLDSFWRPARLRFS